MSCIVCGAQMSAAWADWLLRCGGCGQWASRLSTDFTDVSRSAALDREALGAASDGLRRHNLGRILDAAEAEGRLLDVGAGDGLAMEFAASRGMRCVGIEPDPALAQRCIDRGLSVHPGFFPEDLPESGRFDWVLFNHVIEHVSNPRATLTAAADVLAPGGHIVVHSPSADGTLIALSRALGVGGLSGPLERMWWHNFASPLRHRFTKTSLGRLAEDLGLQVVGGGRTDPLQLQGLWARLGAAQSLRAPSQMVMWLGLASLAPVLRLLPADYFFVILRRKESLK